MVRAYSQRIFPPYSGVVQYAECEYGRAQSFDGNHWEIHFTPGDGRTNLERPRGLGYSREHGFFRVAHIESGELHTYNCPTSVNAADVGSVIDELADYLNSADTPFPLADRFEYWLLDGRDESPLALLYSCCDESQIELLPSRSVWTALPHSKMQIASTEGEQTRGEAPVNSRFQSLIARRAGYNANALWVERQAGDEHIFPPLMVSEDWDHAEETDLCRRYLERLAPRLLMLHGLSHDDRERMEIAAKGQVFEVDEYYPMFPAVNDAERMAAIRVEARLRRSMEIKDTVKKPTHQEPAAKPLSKDMRIIEN